MWARGRVLGFLGVLTVLMAGCAATRYRGTQKIIIKNDKNRMGPWFVSSMLDCQTFFMKAGYSEAFSMTFRSSKNEEGYDCYGGKSGFKTSSAGSNTWTYQKVTSEQPPRDITPYTGTPYPECPTVWQQWPPNNQTYNKWGGSFSKGAPGSKLDLAWDGKTNTAAETETSSKYPWMSVNLKRNYRISMVRILTSSTVNMTNLEVRVGKDTISDANKMFTKNSRCGLYYGPSSGQHWIKMECHRAILGKWITFQLAEQLGGANPKLSIAEIEVYGWGRLCGNEDPWV